jgi:hypothetical protein
MGDKYVFVAHLSQVMKDFVMDRLRLRLIVFQIMAKLRQHVKNIMLGQASKICAFAQIK